MIFTLYKNNLRALNRHDRKCEEKNVDYNWKNCQDEMFYLRKGLKSSAKLVVISRYFRMPRPLEC